MSDALVGMMGSILARRYCWIRFGVTTTPVPASPGPATVIVDGATVTVTGCLSACYPGAGQKVLLLCDGQNMIILGEVVP